MFSQRSLNIQGGRLVFEFEDATGEHAVRRQRMDGEHADTVVLAPVSCPSQPLFKYLIAQHGTRPADAIDLMGKMLAAIETAASELLSLLASR